MMRALMTKALFVLSILLSTQAFAFDVDGLSYSVITGTTDVRVEGCAADSCSSSDIVIPDTVVDSGITYSVTTIAGNSPTTQDRSFFAYDLTSVTIGNSVISIGFSAFASNLLTSVTIPARVESIELSAFFDNALNSAAFEGDFSSFNLSMFLNNPALATITYCDARTGWPQGFNNGSTIITAAPVECATAPPDAPSIDSIAPGNGEVIISFTRGADNGASITGYTAYCFGDTLAFGASSNSPIIVSGLTNGAAYECLVTATNNIGTSLASAASAPFTPAIPPQPPLITNLEPGNGQVSISVSVADDGGSPITGYTAYCFGDTLAFGASSNSPIIVLGLTNGVSYACAVTVANDVGTSPASGISAPVTPVAPPPGC